MILMLSGIALAQTPVSTVVWARPFVLEQPEIYSMSAEKPTFTAGWLVQLTADPSMLAARQVGEPVLYVGEVPAFRFNWDPVGGCLVVFVPGPVDLASTEVFFGSTELPERVTRAHGTEERAAAVAAGIRPLAGVAAARAAGGDVLRVASLEGVYAAAMERVAGCSATPSDHQRSGIPGNR